MTSGNAYPVPEGVPSSVTLHELRLLQHYAAQAGMVLEIGTHLGFSCIGMALAGAHVTSVDPHYEGPADAPDTWEPFLANVSRHGIPVSALAQSWRPGGGGAVQAIRAPIEEVAPRMEHVKFGLVFIDGDHVWPCPMRDARIAIEHLRAPGYVAFHDVTPTWPGVWRTVQELTAWGELHRLDQVGTLGVYQARGL